MSSVWFLTVSTEGTCLPAGAELNGYGGARPMSFQNLATSMRKLPPEFLKFIFKWRIIALQCCAGFCHATTRIPLLLAPQPSRPDHQNVFIVKWSMDRE